MLSCIEKTLMTEEVSLPIKASARPPCHSLIGPRRKTTACKWIQSEPSCLLVKLPKITSTAASINGSNVQHATLISDPSWQDEISSAAADTHEVLNYLMTGTLMQQTKNYLTT